MVVGVGVVPLAETMVTEPVLELRGRYVPDCARVAKKEHVPSAIPRIVPDGETEQMLGVIPVTVRAPSPDPPEAFA